MKKFISMVMAAAMVVTMVPATAFAASATVTPKVADAWEVTVADADLAIADGAITGWNAPELQLTLNDVNASVAATEEAFELTLKLNGAQWEANQVVKTGTVHRAGNTSLTVGTVEVAAVTGATADDPVKEVTVTVKETGAFNFTDGDVICIPLNGMVFTKAKIGEATVKVTGDLKADAVVFAAIVDKGIEVELDEDVVTIAPEESKELETIVIKPTAGYDWDDVLAYKYDIAGGEVVAGTQKAKIVLKASKGFEFLNSSTDRVTVMTADGGSSISGRHVVYGDDTITIYVDKDARGADTKIEVSGIVLEATDAKAGAEATIKVSTNNLDSKSVVVATVVDMAVIMELVDPDEDVPTFYNGVNVENTGLTVDDDHISLEVKIYETFKGAWLNHKDFTLSLPEGVHVVTAEGVDAEDVNGTFTEGGLDTDLEALFGAAYIRGEHEEFAFRRGSFEETHADDATDPHEIRFTLTLVADPDFVGDVVLKLEGAALDTQEVTIAKVLAPYTVKAEQNDVIIDYRYTEVPTDIVITEAEAGLWAEGLEVAFAVERADMIQFEDDATITVDEVSGMEIEDDFTLTATLAEDVRPETVVAFRVDVESDEEPAVVTISDIELFMQRNIPAGPYSLDVAANTATEAFEAEVLFAADADEDFVDDVCDYSTTVHEAFVNVVTAGRDQDDASFTTKIVVPVGETTMYAGEKAITLDVPAYINAAGYTMLPVRAVATALGINNDAVQWDQATKTVIIMYGQRIITMTAGSSVVYVSGTAIPAKAAVEIVDGRAFLGLRDLATTLGIATVNYDATTKTATLN